MTTELDKPRTYKIPATIEGAVDEASILGQLMFSAGWKRSAIVRAFIRKHNGRPSKDMESHGFLTIDSFSRLGIVGLRDINTVRRYYDAWGLTGLPDPKPGETIDLPSIEADFPALLESKRQPSVSSGKAGNGGPYVPPVEAPETYWCKECYKDRAWELGDGTRNCEVCGFHMAPEPSVTSGADYRNPPITPHDTGTETDQWKANQPEARPLDNYTPEDAIRDYEATLSRIATEVARMATDKEGARKRLHDVIDRSFDA